MPTSREKGTVSTRTTKMFHSIRITGNESMHPGTIDLNDDTELANALFFLINLIVFDVTSYGKYAVAVWEKMPEGKRNAAEERDMTKAPEMLAENGSASKSSSGHRFTE